MAKNTASKKRKKKKPIKWGLVAALTVMALFLGLASRLFLLEIIIVEGDSMLPTYQSEAKTVVTKINYLGDSTPRRDDCVLLSFDMRGGSFIKRVAGVPGDEIELRDGMLIINGYEMGALPNNPALENGTIPKGKYLVLSDNREKLGDSRSLGLVSLSNIKGKVLFSFN